MQLFPLDENGDVLRRMVEHGDNLNVSRDIDFVVVTPDERAAQRLAETVRTWGFEVRIECAGTVSSLPWEVRVVRHMLPTHEGITQLERRLAAEAALLGGAQRRLGVLAAGLISAPSSGETRPPSRWCERTKPRLPARVIFEENAVFALIFAWCEILDICNGQMRGPTIPNATRSKSRPDVLSP